VATEAQPAKQAKLLVVEDDVLVRMLLADMIGEIGYTVAAEAGSVDEALEATRETEFDLAILDADLNGRSVSPVADALVARDIGFVFVTGCLSRPADPQEAIPDRCAEAVLQERPE
jgi:CheY-like chemotaxis protein